MNPGGTSAHPRSTLEFFLSHQRRNPWTHSVTGVIRPPPQTDPLPPAPTFPPLVKNRPIKTLRTPYGTRVKVRRGVSTTPLVSLLRVPCTGTGSGPTSTVTRSSTVTGLGGRCAPDRKVVVGGGVCVCGWDTWQCNSKERSREG